MLDYAIITKFHRITNKLHNSWATSLAKYLDWADLEKINLWSLPQYFFLDAHSWGMWRTDKKKTKFPSTVMPYESHIGF